MSGWLWCRCKFDYPHRFYSFIYIYIYTKGIIHKMPLKFGKIIKLPSCIVVSQFLPHFLHFRPIFSHHHGAIFRLQFLQLACSPTTMSPPINCLHFWPSITTIIYYHRPYTTVIDTVSYCRSLKFYHAISSPATLFGPTRTSSWLLPNKSLIATGLCSQRRLNHHWRVTEAFWPPTFRPNFHRSELRSLPPTAQNCSLSSDDSKGILAVIYGHRFWQPNSTTTGDFFILRPILLAADLRSSCR